MPGTGAPSEPNPVSTGPVPDVDGDAGFALQHHPYLRMMIGRCFRAVLLLDDIRMARTTSVVAFQLFSPLFLTASACLHTSVLGFSSFFFHTHTDTNWRPFLVTRFSVSFRPFPGIPMLRSQSASLRGRLSMNGRWGAQPDECRYKDGFLKAPLHNSGDERARRFVLCRDGWWFVRVDWRLVDLMHFCLGSPGLLLHSAG